MRRDIYKRPDKPLRVPVPKRDWINTPKPEPIAAPVTVHAGTECHVTPPAVATRMVDLVATVNADVLEPSAGTGNIVRAILAAGCRSLTMVELHATLAAGLRSIGSVEQADFLEYAKECPRRFGAIIMNPPFKTVRAHISAAVSLLDDGGTLVALVPVTFERDGFHTIETLPADTFATAKVNTKIVQFWN